MSEYLGLVQTEVVPSLTERYRSEEYTMGNRISAVLLEKLAVFQKGFPLRSRVLTLQNRDAHRNGRSRCSRENDDFVFTFQVYDSIDNIGTRSNWMKWVRISQS